MRTMKGYIQLTRPVNLLIAFLSIFIGGFITGTIHPLIKLLLACVSGTLIAAGANAVNDYFDIDIDRVNKPHRPLPSRKVTLGQAHLFSILLFVAGVGFSILIHLLGTVIALCSSIMLYLYSYRLKRTVLWGNIAVGLITGLAFVYGGSAVGRYREALIVGVFAFFYHWGREIIKDAEDVEGDRSQGITTLPIKHGIKAALGWATGVLIFLIGLTIFPYILGIFSFYYFLTVLLGVDFFLVYVIVSMWKHPDPKNLGRLSMLMKVDMLMGLLAVYLG